MNIKEKIKTLLGYRELQEEAISDLEKIREKGKPSRLDPDLDIPVIQDGIRKNEQEVLQLKRQYDQQMLSRMVKGGIDDDEMISWWMNRY